LVGCCVVVLCLVVCLVLLCRSVASPCHVALCCVVTSCRHDTLSRCLVVLSSLASLLCHAPSRISSHQLCSVGCCVVALRLVVASPCASCRCDLLSYRLLLSVVVLRLFTTSRHVFFFAGSGLVGCCISCPQPLVARCHFNIDLPSLFISG
jgi:hypothetical protein